MMTTALKPLGKYQKRGKGFFVAFIWRIRLANNRCCSSACGMDTLLKLTQSGSGSKLAAPKYKSSERAGQAWTVPRLSRPCRVALSGVDDRPGEVVSKGRRLSGSSVY